MRDRAEDRNIKVRDRAEGRHQSEGIDHWTGMYCDGLEQKTGISHSGIERGCESK